MNFFARNAALLRRLAVVLASLLLLAASAVAQGGVLTPHGVARIRNVSAVAIAPDGQSIAYILSVPRQPLAEEDGAAWAELYVVGSDSASRGLVTGRVNVSAAAWTRDGRISFLMRRSVDRATSLFVVSPSGGDPRKILEHDTSLREYAWSPDGKRVAFLAQDAMPEARRRLRERGFNQEIYEEEVPFVRVWVAELESGQKRMLDLPGSATTLSWSPEASGGARLAVALAPTPLVDDDLMRRRVHVVDADSGKVIANLNNPGKLGPVAWSPDGKHIALISAADINDPFQGRLMVVAVTGGPLRDLIPNYAGHVSAIAWQGNDSVMFIGDEGTATTFNKVGLDGAKPKVIFPAGGSILTGFSLSADGLSAAFIAETPAHPAEIYRAKHGDAAAKRVTDSNPWLADMRWAKQEVVKFKARDGLALEGVLVRPLDEKAGTRYPLILTVHGGPEAHYRNGWMTSYSSPGQVAAARGFAVFYPNYRGSTGRGVKFSKLSQGDPAGKEFDDLVDAVDHLIKTGLVDRAKVGVTGGSYGGYATGWCSTYYSERFAAGVMFVGISDKLSKVGTTDITDEEYYVHARHRLWDKLPGGGEAWNLFLKHSPIYYAGKSRTPLLILGGTDDPRVHPSQSLEMYRHMKLRSKAPVRLIRYPGEQHGNRRAASRLDYNLRMLQWLEHYLKGPGGPPPPADLDYSEPR